MHRAIRILLSLGVIVGLAMLSSACGHKLPLTLPENTESPAEPNNEEDQEE